MNKEIEKDIKKYNDLESVANTRGGKQLIAYLESGVGSAIAELCAKYKTRKPEELLPMIAELDEKLNLLQALTRASSQKDLALKALKEEEKRLNERIQEED